MMRKLTAEESEWADHLASQFAMANTTVTAQARIVFLLLMDKWYSESVSNPNEIVTSATFDAHEARENAAPLVADIGKSAIRELSSILRVSVATVSKYIRELVQYGLLEPFTDGRKRKAYLCYPRASGDEGADNG